MTNHLVIRHGYPFRRLRAVPRVALVLEDLCLLLLLSWSQLQTIPLLGRLVLPDGDGNSQ
jgi:hypothetical protein